MDAILCFLRYFSVVFEVMSGMLISCCLCHVASLGNIILIQSKNLFALTPLCCVIWWRNSRYQYVSLWFDTTRTHDDIFVLQPPVIDSLAISNSIDISEDNTAEQLLHTLQVTDSDAFTCSLDTTSVPFEIKLISGSTSR